MKFSLTCGIDKAQKVNTFSLKKLSLSHLYKLIEPGLDDIKLGNYDWELSLLMEDVFSSYYHLIFKKRFAVF